MAHGSDNIDMMIAQNEAAALERAASDNKPLVSKEDEAYAQLLHDALDASLDSQELSERARLLNEEQGGKVLSGITRNIDTLNVRVRDDFQVHGEHFNKLNDAGIKSEYEQQLEAFFPELKAETDKVKESVKEAEQAFTGADTEGVRTEKVTIEQATQLAKLRAQRKQMEEIGRFDLVAEIDQQINNLSPKSDLHEILQGYGYSEAAAEIDPNRSLKDKIASLEKWRDGASDKIDIDYYQQQIDQLKSQLDEALDPYSQVKAKIIGLKKKLEFEEGVGDNLEEINRLKDEIKTLESALPETASPVIAKTETPIPQPTEAPPQAAAPKAAPEASPQAAAEMNEARAEQRKQYKEADAETAQALTAIAKDIASMWNTQDRQLMIEKGFDCSHARPLSLETIGAALLEKVKATHKPERLAEVYIGGEVNKGVDRLIKRVAEVNDIAWDVAVGANAVVVENNEAAATNEVNAEAQNHAQAAEAAAENKDSSGELQMSAQEAQNALKEIQIFLDSLNKKLNGTGMGERMKPIIDQMRKYGSGAQGEFAGLQAYINRFGADDDALAGKGFVESILKKMAHEMQADLQYLQSKGVFSERSFPQGAAGKILQEALRGGQVTKAEASTPSDLSSKSIPHIDSGNSMASAAPESLKQKVKEDVVEVKNETESVIIDENTEFVLPAHLHPRVAEKFEGVNPDAITPQQVDEVYKAIDYPPGAPTEPFKTENIRQLVRAKVGKGKTEAKNAPHAEIKEQKAVTLADIKNFINSENINSYIGAAEQQTVRKILELVKSLPFDQQTAFERDYNPNEANPGREYAKLASVQKAVIEKVLDLLENRGGDNALPEVNPIASHEFVTSGAADNSAEQEEMAAVPLTDEEIEAMKMDAYLKTKKIGEGNEDLMIYPVNWRIGKRFNSHGLAKESVPAQLRQLLVLLDKGIDPNKEFHTAPLEVNPDHAAGLGAGLGTGGGTSYKDGSFIVMGEIDSKIGESGIKYIAVNDGYYDAIPRLQKAYPQVEFIRADQLDNRLTEIANEKDGLVGMKSPWIDGKKNIPEQHGPDIVNIAA